MRLTEPRVKPLEPDEWDDQAQAVLAPIAARGEVLNIFKTLANHPDLLRRWLVFANHILGKSTLAPRERELVILRIGYLCQSGYEWGQHVLIARQAGMSDDEIRAARTGPDTAGLTELDRLLLTATDELHADAHVSDATWRALSKHLTTQQLMDLVFTVGQYNLVSMALNSFGVQGDEGLPGWDV
jgi:4-carboxymuconolactone decarboxylase